MTLVPRSTSVRTSTVPVRTPRSRARTPSPAELTADLTAAMLRRGAAEKMREVLQEALKLAITAHATRTTHRIRWALSSAQGAVRNAGYHVTRAQTALDDYLVPRVPLTLVPGTGEGGRSDG